MPAMALPKPAAEAVLDTNVVLDWLLFDDPVGRLVGGEVVSGALRWVTTRAMMDELSAVLSRPGLERWQARIASTLRAAEAHGFLVDPPSIRSLPLVRCTDPDDQKFIDLALHRSTTWLFSRDKALLKLARFARLRGVSVLRPAEWLTTRQT
jgi:predicted nucleic acid-binding protein